MIAPGYSVALTGATGTIAFTNTSIDVADASGFVVNGGAPDVDFTGTMDVDIGAILDVRNTTGGTMTFTGTFAAAGDGILITDAAGSAIAVPERVRAPDPPPDLRP